MNRISIFPPAADGRKLLENDEKCWVFVVFFFFPFSLGSNRTVV